MFRPQLAVPLNPRQLPKYVENDGYWMEQKLDGVRMAIEVDNGHIQGWGRRDNETTIPREIRDVLSALNGRWVFDGEYIGGVFWCFDLMVEAGNTNISETSPYTDRRVALEAAAPILVGATDKFRVLRTHRTTAEKAELVTKCIKNNAEGVMVKDILAPYWQGKRSPKMMKAKFVDTIDCVVTEVGREGKRSVEISLFDNGQLKVVGACTVTDRWLAQLQVGDVIEVKYLYATKDHRIYQPSFLKRRDDKKPEECSFGQMKYANKTVFE